MVLILSKRSLLALLPYFIQTQATVSGDASGSGVTTRYWDCCKTSCAWSGKTTLASGATPVETCSIDDTPLSDPNATSGCDGGDAYMCSDNSPWAVSADLAYGYAAVNIAGGSEDSWCCACYELTFTSTAIAGKKMIVQATNTGSDLGSNQFDIAVPGGGVGIFNGCTAEWGAPESGWGAQYGGISSASACSTFPTALQPGCDWRYDWFEGANNPTVDFVQVECPAALTAKTGCVRSGEDPTGPSSVSTYDGSGVSSSPATSSVAAATSSTVASVIPTTSSIAFTSATQETSAVSSVAAVSSAASSVPVVESSVGSSVATQSTAVSSVLPVAESSTSPIAIAPSSIAVVSSPVASSLASMGSSSTLSTSIESPTTTAAPTKTRRTSVIMVTVTAKPSDVIAASSGSGDGDFCEL